MEALGKVRQSGRTESGAGSLLACVEQWCLYLSMAAVLVMGALIVAAICGRWLFSLQIPDDVLLVRDLMIVAIAMPQAAVATARQNIVVEVFTDRASERTKARLDTIGNLVGLVLFAFLTWGAGTEFWHAWQSGAYYDGDLDLPQWPGRFACFFGFGMLTLRLGLSVIDNSTGLSPRSPEV